MWNFFWYKNLKDASFLHTLKIVFFMSSMPKIGFEFFLNIQFCRVLRALANHVKISTKEIYSVLELFSFNIKTINLNIYNQRYWERIFFEK